MSPDMTRDNTEIDQVKPSCMFDVSNDEEIRESLSWKKTQRLLNEVHSEKGTKKIFSDYQLQFIKAYQLIKLNDGEGLNKDLHC